MFLTTYQCFVNLSYKYQNVNSDSVSLDVHDSSMNQIQQTHPSTCP